jgi:hypothetical protein
MSSKNLFTSRLALVLCILVVFNVITFIVVYRPGSDARFSLGSLVSVVLFFVAATPGALIGSIGPRFFRRFMAALCIGALIAHPVHKLGLITFGPLGLPSHLWANCCLLLAPVVSLGTGLLLGRPFAKNTDL